MSAMCSTRSGGNENVQYDWLHKRYPYLIPYILLHCSFHSHKNSRNCVCSPSATTPLSTPIICRINELAPLSSPSSPSLSETQQLWRGTFSRRPSTHTMRPRWWLTRGSIRRSTATSIPRWVWLPLSHRVGVVTSVWVWLPMS